MSDTAPAGPPIRDAATVLLVRRIGGKLGDPTAGSEAVGWRVTTERTRDQSISYADPASTAKFGTALFGAFTGDPEIDTILAGYTRPPSIGAA